uniref:Uncharacterized protein n=1 Tax=Romanomermis culicivorax TaxID=13658 RepID=A0A915KH96_ROMCU
MVGGGETSGQKRSVMTFFPANTRSRTSHSGIFSMAFSFWGLLTISHASQETRPIFRPLLLRSTINSMTEGGTVEPPVEAAIIYVWNIE